jgi:hypothetical protein
VSPAAAVAKPAGYSGTPLPKKLGLKAGARVALVGAPPRFEATLGALPSGAVARRGLRGPADLTLWFVRSRAELLRGIVRMAPRGEASGLWICWAKGSSPLKRDVGEADVRRAALAHGLVDFKICAVDADWSGLRFNLRAAAPGNRR